MALHFMIKGERIFVLSFVLLLLGGTPSRAYAPGVGIAQPTNYVSQNGTYSLFVDPADWRGSGSAFYRLTRNGLEVWSGEKSYTMREVVVSDEGFAAGMIYRSVRSESDDGRSEEYLHIVILSATGQELRNEVRRRHAALHTHGPTLPEIEQFIGDVDNDRIVVRVRTRHSEWWVYRLSTGEELARFDSNTIAPQHDHLRMVVDVQPIPKTPLFLVHWYAKSPDHAVRDAGGVFALVHLEVGPVWSWEAPQDYAQVDFGWGRGRGPIWYFLKNPAISSAADARFEIRLFAERKSVLFSVRPSADGWSVTELGRSKLPDDAGDENIGFPDATPLTYLGELPLAADPEESPLHGLWDFTFDSQGRIYVVRRSTDNTFSLLSLGPDGAVTDERELSPSDLPWMGRHWTEVPRHKDDRYVEFRKDGEDKYSAWSIHLPTGEERPLKHYPGGIATSLSRFADGGLVVLDTYSRQYSPADRLRCFDANGDLVWERRSDNRDDYEILSIGPRSVVVTAQQQVVLLNINSLHLFDRAGNHLKKIDLKGAFGDNEFGGRPGSLSRVVADADGGFLLADFRNPPVVLRYQADGSLRSRWSPRHPDGRTFGLGPQIRVAPDGRLWTGDGKSILRLTDDGVVDFVIGPQPQSDRLEGIAAFNVGPDGNLYVVAEGTGNVHVFGASGKFKRIIKPDPEDMAGTVRSSFIAVSEDSIYLKKPATRVFMPPDEYLRFSLEGEQLGTVTFVPSLPVSEFFSSGWAFQPGTGYRCGICGIAGDTRLVIVDPPDKMVRELRRRPNGQWFGNDTTIAVAPDGSIAVLNHDIFGKADTFEIDLFSPEGEPLRTIRLPTPTKRYTGLCQDGHRAIVVGNAEAIIVDLVSGRTGRFALVPPGIAEGRWSAFLPPSASNELLLFDQRGRKIHRYQLPAVRAQTAVKRPTEIAGRPPDPAQSVIRSARVQRYQEVVESLPKPLPCVLYGHRVNRGERIVTEAQAAELSEIERAELRLIDLSDCGNRFDAPRIYSRILDIVANADMDDFDGIRVLDFGCCDLRHAQALARMGAEVTHAQVDFDITTMCNDWSDIGNIVGPNGRTGHLKVIRAAEMAPDKAAEVLGGDFDLVTVRNILLNPAPEDYFSAEKWWNLALATEKKAVPKQLHALLRPGGWLLVYNVAFDPIPVENAIDREAWESTGFTVWAFDADDRDAAIGIGAELGWEERFGPLDDRLDAKFSLLQRPYSP